MDALHHTPGHQLPKDSRRAWDVGGSIAPKTEGNPRDWAATVTLHVVAANATRAIELVEKKYPGITVHTVQHRGVLDIIEG